MANDKLEALCLMLDAQGAILANGDVRLHFHRAAALLRAYDALAEHARHSDDCVRRNREAGYGYACTCDLAEAQQAVASILEAL